jgi:hydroxymethylpyrimidine/phosphomethylpyrimidine kinase
VKGRVLIIAGSDSGGGAGIQADIKTVTALGGYAMTAITALTAQNTEGVFAIHDVPPEFVAEQIKVVLNDLGADCIKIGMLHRPDIIKAVRDSLDEHGAGIPMVLDPVMVAKGGAPLLAPEAMDSLKDLMIPRAEILTPNLPEAEALSGLAVTDEASARQVAAKLAALGPKAVLLKGGHMPGNRIVDILMQGGQVVESFEGTKVDTPHTHGTGCTLASSIAAGVAQGLSVRDAVERGRRYVLAAILSAPGFGHGHGPLNHAHTVGSF